MFKSRLKRYAGLIAAITLLSSFVIIVIVGNHYVDSNIIQRDSFNASRVQNFAQLIQRVGAEDKALHDEIIDHLQLLRDGGELVSEHGPSWRMDAVTDTGLLSAISKVEAAEIAQDYAEFKDAYLAFSNLSAQLSSKSLKRVGQTRFMVNSIVGISAISIIGMLLFRLNKADDETRRIISENNQILSAVDHGLFLINPQFQISEQKSDALANIFGRRDYMSGNFFDVLREQVSRQDRELAREYIELLFEGRVVLDLVQDLNPLREIEMKIVSSSETLTTKYLNFNFARDKRSGVANSILVSVADVTNEVSLRQELESTKAMQKERMNLFLGLLHVQPEKLLRFCDDSAKEMRAINDILADEDLGRAKMLSKLDDIFRRAHRVKGDAGALGLGLFENSLHRFEDQIDAVKIMPTIEGSSVLELTVQLRDMINETETVKNLVPQLAALALQGEEEPSLDEPSFFAELDGDQTYDEALDKTAELEESISVESFSQSMQLLVDQACERQGKKAVVDTTGFEILGDKPEALTKLNSLCVQLLRNSVMHGIESPQERFQKSKTSFGIINLSLQSMGDNVVKLLVQDDGRGLQFDRIRARAIESKLLSIEDSEKVDDRGLLKFLFMPGFSSIDDVSLDAGRGVGLDFVRTEAIRMGGKISVSTKAGSYTKFVLSLPIAA